MFREFVDVGDRYAGGLVDGGRVWQLGDEVEVFGGHREERVDVAVVYPDVGVRHSLYEEGMGVGLGYVEVAEGVDGEAGPVGGLEGAVLELGLLLGLDRDEGGVDVGCGDEGAVPEDEGEGVWEGLVLEADGEVLDLQGEVFDDVGGYGIRLFLCFGDGTDGGGHALEVYVLSLGVSVDELVEGEVVVDGDREVFIGFLGQLDFLLGHRLPFVRRGIFPVFEVF